MDDNVFRISISSDSKLSKIMDEFTECDENGNNLYGEMRLCFANRAFTLNGARYDVEFIIKNEFIFSEDYISFTDIRNGDFYGLRSFLHRHYESEKELEEAINSKHDIIFKNPFALKAKLPFQIGKGSTAGGTIPYGYANKYEFIGLHMGYYTGSLYLNKRTKPRVANLYNFD